MRHFVVSAVLAVLCLSATSYGSLFIDDFESYWGTPALQMVWTDDSPGPSSATDTLIIGGVPQGEKAMDVDYMVAGGWQQPGNPTDYSSWDFASTGMEFAPVDFSPGCAIGMFIKIESGWDADLLRTNYFLIEYTGDKWAQTWNVGPAAAHVQWWMDPATVPAVIGPDGWVFPNWGGFYYQGYADKGVISPDDGWQEIVITDKCYVPWGDSLVSFNAMTGIHLQLWSGWDDTSGASGGPKLEGTVTKWPKGPLTGSIDVDYIRFIVPEPITVALIGLGGLALLRKKR